jgi:glycosyltransferase involved in cell wall biosynthesis
MSHKPRLVVAITDSVSTALLRGQLRHASEAGFEVWLLSGPGQALEQFGDEERVTVKAVSWQRGLAPLGDLRGCLQAFWVFRRIRPAIVNASTPKAGLLATLAAFLAGVPIRIFTLRGLRSTTLTGVARFVVGYSEWLTCRLATDVVCISQGIREAAVARGIVPAAKARVLAHGSSNGIDVARFAATPEKIAAAAQLRQSLSIPAASPVIGFVGRLVRDKGVPELVAAYTSLRDDFPDLQLLLVGPAESGNALPASIRQQIDSLPGIRAIGSVADPSTAYLAMDVLALPTHREGFGNVLLEAGAMGLPVVASAVEGCLDAVADGATGALVPVGDVPRLAAALNAYLRDPDLRRRHGEAGRARVAACFRQELVWEAQAAHYQTLLASLSSRRR